MRWSNRWAIGGLGLLVVAAMVAGGGGRQAVTKASPPDEPDSTEKQDSPLVVHEWGTFTHFAGSNGVLLDFRPLVDSELPVFVHDRYLQSAGPLLKKRIKSRLRMETPVIYFYTDREREVSARVGFPSGLLTEFYPPPWEIGPAWTGPEQPPLKNSFLDWGRFRIVPQPADPTSAEAEALWIPTIEGDNHYAYARETDSAIVVSKDRWEFEHHEKFLFYRGIGNLEMPLRFEALGSGQFRVTNQGTDKIEGLFLMAVDSRGLRYVGLPPLAPGEAVERAEPAQVRPQAELEGELVESLVSTGLYRKEALAMVKTWRTSWFEEGTRLLYLVPRRLTDEVLPLSIEPAPDELVRVLVGRTDIITPEQSNRLMQIVRSMGTCVNPLDEPLRDELLHWGRFVEPAIHSTARQTPDLEMRASLERLARAVRELE